MSVATREDASVVVGIVTRDRAGLLQKAVQSALDQSHRPLRVAVVDDASSDETPALRNRFPGVTWERREQPEGYLRARNHLMLDGQDAFYVSLDDDAWFLRGDEIALAVEHLTKHPNVAAVAFDILSPDDPTVRPRTGAREVAAFIGCGHVLRLSCIRALGGYSEFPGTYGAEETDLCLRLVDAGHDVVRLDGVHVWHDKTVLARDAARQHRSGVCNDLAIALRRAPAMMLLPTLAWKLMRQLMFAIRAGRIATCLGGVGDFICAAPGLWASRRAVRASSIARFRALSRSRPARV